MKEPSEQTPSTVCPVCGTVSTTPRLVAINKHGRYVLDAQGLEISEDGRSRCRQQGLTVTSAPIEIADFAGRRFDVITMWHVLEHLPHPADTLRAARSHLASKGVVILAVPNHRCLGFHLGGADWFHLDSPRHLFLPSRQTVERLASDAGFRVVTCHHQWFECPLDLWWSVRSSPHRWWVWAGYPIVKRLSPETALYVLCVP